MNIEQLADDASAGLSLLAVRPEVAGRAVGIAGVSQGRLIAPRAAALNGHAAFMLILTAPTTTLYDIILFQDPSGQAVADARRGHVADSTRCPACTPLTFPAYG